MSFPLKDNEETAPVRRRFVIVLECDQDTVLDHFEATDWAPAIMVYAERIRREDYGQPVALRQARPGEVRRLPQGR